MPTAINDGRHCVGRDDSIGPCTDETTRRSTADHGSGLFRKDPSQYSHHLIKTQ